MKIRVLFVDDEPRLLEGLQRSLRGLRKEWEMSFASSGQEALASMRANEFDVIVTDMRMPSMDGVALLKQVTETHPGLLRIVLSGQSDLDSIVKASGVAHQFLSKPCPQENLRGAIVQAFALKEKMTAPDLRYLVSSIDALPSVPDLYVALTQAFDSPDPSALDVGRIISRDVAMSAKILQLMNSAFFGTSRRVSDPVEAVNYIGTNAIKALVAGAHAFRRLDDQVSAAYNLGGLSARSHEFSRLAERIAKDLSPGDKELHNQARTAGLLRDIGQAVLACKLPEQFAHITNTVNATGVTFWEASRGKLGVSHAEIGAYLLGLWGLPTPIVEAVAFHRCPSDYAGNELNALAVVHIATGISGSRHAGVDGSHPVDEAYLERIGLRDRVGMEVESWSNWAGVAA